MACRFFLPGVVTGSYARLPTPIDTHQGEFGLVFDNSAFLSPQSYQSPA